MLNASILEAVSNDLTSYYQMLRSPRPLSRDKLLDINTELLILSSKLQALRMKVREELEKDVTK